MKLMNINVTPRAQKIGCLSNLVTFGALLSGLYQGSMNKQGMSIAPGMKEFIMYGPVAVNTLLGIPIAASALADNSETLDEVVDTALDKAAKRAPVMLDKNEAKRFAKGCTYVQMPIQNGLLTAAAEGIGYLIGYYVL